jgi:WhiB family transcriptional regulator, redox-sensing transcriptional regulator
MPPENVPLSRALGSTPPLERWEDEGRMWGCRSADPDIFFPDKSDGGAAAAAKAICRRCPVVIECGNWALETEQRYGVWGGLSEHDRRRVRARMGFDVLPDGLSHGTSRGYRFGCRCSACRASKRAEKEQAFRRRLDRIREAS